MRGFTLVGRMHGGFVDFVQPVDASDVLMFALDETGGCQRPGYVTVRAVRNYHQCHWIGHVPAATDGDYVFKATAIGERIFAKEPA